MSYLIISNRYRLGNYEFTDKLSEKVKADFRLIYSK